MHKKYLSAASHSTIITNDLFLAAFLSTVGCTLDRIEKNERRRVSFVFVGERVRELREAYRTGPVHVDMREFRDNLNRLRDRLGETCYQLRTRREEHITCPQAAPCTLSRSTEGLHYAGTTLTYRITGLTAYNLDRLRVTLKATTPDSPTVFHIDTVDLYNSRGRELFAEACAKYLKAQTGAVMAKLMQIIAALESERITMREKGSTVTIPPMSEEERTAAIETLKSNILLKRIVEDFDAIGYIGEKTNKLIAYIATVSRLLVDPLAVLILSRSGAGKTSLQNAACKFVPPESAIQYTRLTGQALFYREANALKNKVLAIEEDEGMQAAMYSVKTLISAQKLSVSTTRTDPKTGKLSADEYAVNGPVVVFVSTTRPNGLDDETKRRFLILTIDESEEQTKQILMAQRTKCSPRWYEMTSGENAVTKLHHNMQRLLKPLDVMIPDDLKITWPTRRIQYRGEQAKYFSLIKAITLLFQYQRKTGCTRSDRRHESRVRVCNAEGR